MSEPEEILQKYWGFDTFRPLQKEIIDQVLLGRDVIALLPTGGGKSICFQVPALVKPGICIVVSPLIALMEDQVSTLRAKGIKAMAITGGISFSELDALMDNCIYGNYKFLYLSPERLQQEMVQERIRQMPVNLVAVDEAHCISEWGHDFRPAYREIAILKQILPDIPTIGLTATAIGKVVDDIADQLEMTTPVVIKKSFERKNLAYRVAEEVTNKEDYLVSLLKDHADAAIIYVRRRRESMELAALLNAHGISANCYHGGLLAKERSERLQRWLRQDDLVMVATSAFGMGIDKANVRTVVHTNLPESLESYFQEAGRAGRDGILSQAILITASEDSTRLKEQFLKNLPTPNLVKLVYKKLVTFFRIAYGEGEGTAHYFNFSEFCQRYGLQPVQAYNALSLLDRTSVLTFTEQYQKSCRIQFLVPGRQLQIFLEANPRFEAVVKCIQRTYGGSFEDKIEIDLPAICAKVGTIPPEAVQLLQELNDREIAAFEYNQHDTKVTFLVPREDDATIYPLLPHIQRQLETKEEKIERVLEYITNKERCKSEQLLQYFGETQTRPCGLCSVCIPSGLTPTRDEMIAIFYSIKKLLKEKERSAAELVESMDYPEHHVLHVLQLVLEKGSWTLTDSKKFKLKN